MAKPPVVSGREAIRVFERVGFVQVRHRGSHAILKKDRHRNLLSIPIHKGQTLKAGTLRQLIASAGMTIDEFREWLAGGKAES